MEDLTYDYSKFLGVLCGRMNGRFCYHIRQPVRPIAALAITGSGNRLWLLALGEQSEPDEYGCRRGRLAALRQCPLNHLGNSQHKLDSEYVRPPISECTAPASCRLHWLRAMSVRKWRAIPGVLAAPAARYAVAAVFGKQSRVELPTGQSRSSRLPGRLTHQAVATLR